MSAASGRRRGRLERQWAEGTRPAAAGNGNASGRLIGVWGSIVAANDSKGGGSQSQAARNVGVRPGGRRRLWPLECAARAGKPVFCLPGLEDDADNADALARRVEDARLPVMMAASAGFTPASLRLAQFQREQMGSPRLLLCDSFRSRP